MLEEAGLMYLSILGIMLALLLYVGYKVGFSVRAFKKQWLYSEGSSNIVYSILKIPTIIVVIGIILFTLNNCEASEINWFDGGSVFAGIDYTPNKNPFCQEAGINNNMASNMGATQNILNYRTLNLGVKYTHHSCVLNPDAPVNYDAIGIYTEWVW